jgi:hypothetical protein
MTPSLPALAGALGGAEDPMVSGSQNDVQPPVQWTLPSASTSELYSALPLEATNTRPMPSTCLVAIVVELRGVVVAGESDESPPPAPPHAASSRVARSATGTVSSRLGIAFMPVLPAQRPGGIARCAPVQ